MADKYERMLELLAQTDDWMTASELADQLGVTTRSVRNYVAAAKTAAHPLPILAASTAGYRLNRDAFAQAADWVAEFSRDADGLRTEGAPRRNRVQAA